MTITDGVGQSEYTQVKEDHYASILGWQVNVAIKAMHNQYKPWHKTYLLIDATAGSGILEGDIEGSPLRALRVMDAKGIDYRAVFVEQDLTACASLHSALFGRKRSEVRNTPYQQIIGEFCKQPDPLQLGVLYIDPNGTPDFEALKQFAGSFPAMEVLISVTANGVKRAGKTDADLGEWIKRIGKRHWLIRELYTKWQWTFLFGSNYPGFSKPYERIGLYPTTSETGRMYLDRASLSKEELRKKVQPPLIELTPNTCVTQPTGLFVPSQFGERAEPANGARRDL